MDYVTSDLHIGHDKDFIWGARGFSSIEEHDLAILKTWNHIVKPEDTVYILGDLCLGHDHDEWDRVYKNLNGHIKFIRGNHDTDNKIARYISEYGMEYLGLAYYYRYSKNRNFLLSHYPTLVGNYDDTKFLWNLSGHTHASGVFQNGTSCVYNVAWDAHYRPISIEQIIKDIEKYRQNFLQGDK